MSEGKNLDLVSRLNGEERIIKEHALFCVCPDDGKYEKDTRQLADYLSPQAEWMEFCKVQFVLIETRMEFGKAEQWNVDEVREALKKVNPLNMSLLEDELKHDQQAVLAEIGRFVSPETRNLLHPGTTSYDIVDTARAALFKEAWYEKIRPAVEKSALGLAKIAEEYIETLQVGRTHLQNTSPILFGGYVARFARRITERMLLCDQYFDNLKGKVSGIVGTGASIEMVIGEGKSEEFEIAVLKKLGLKPDETASQITSKEVLADIGHGLTTLMYVLANFCEDGRKLYSSAIQEVTSLDDAERLKGSSADAGKNNPINHENIAGKAAIIESGMRVVYEMMRTDFERDLRNSVQGRYQPQMMMTEVFEAFTRLNKRVLPVFHAIKENMQRNLESVRMLPTEAMTAILRGEAWSHPEYGDGHDFVSKMTKKAKMGKTTLLEAAMTDSYFAETYKRLSDNKKRILQGELELYTGHANLRGKRNITYVTNQIAPKHL